MAKLLAFNAFFFGMGVNIFWCLSSQINIVTIIAFMWKIVHAGLCTTNAEDIMDAVIQVFYHSRGKEPKLHLPSGLREIEVGDTI